MHCILFMHAIFAYYICNYACYLCTPYMHAIFLSMHSIYAYYLWIISMHNIYEYCLCTLLIINAYYKRISMHTIYAYLLCILSMHSIGSTVRFKFQPNYWHRLLLFALERFVIYCKDISSNIVLLLIINIFHFLIKPYNQSNQWHWARIVH